MSEGEEWRTANGLNEVAPRVTANSGELYPQSLQKGNEGQEVSLVRQKT